MKTITMSTILEEQTLAPENAVATTPQLDLQTLPASELFFNREASLLEFHRRVLQEALDPYKSAT